MQVKQLLDKALLASVEPDAFLRSIENTVAEMNALQVEQVDKSVELVLESLRSVEAKMKEALAQEAQKLQKGLDGRDGAKGDKGEKGAPGANGKDGRDGKDGKDGIDGKDGADGISVSDARVDFDGSLVIVLSDGREINAGEVIGEGVQDRTALITQINTLLPDQTGNSGKYLTTNGSTLSWASVSGGSGTVTSVAMTVPTGLTVSGSPVTTSGTLAVSYTAGYSIPTTASQSNWDTAYSWGNHASAGYVSTSGSYANPSWITSLAYSKLTGAPTLPSGTIVGTTDSQTLTNKRITPRVSSTASASSVTPDISAYDVYAFTALAANLTINAPTGTPADGEKITLRILDNGTSRTLTWNGTYTAIGVTLPTSTTANKTVYIGCVYNAANTRWDVIAVTTQA
jgi:hypothetical protein